MQLLLKKQVVRGSPESEHNLLCFGNVGSDKVLAPMSLWLPFHVMLVSRELLLHRLTGECVK